MTRLSVVAVGLAAAIGCTNEGGITNLCGQDANGFDITEASVLQDAQGFTGLHDAVILEVPDGVVPEGAVWRVKLVEVLAMVPSSEFDGEDGGEKLTIEVWDGDDPTASAPFRRTEAFDPASLTWEHVELTNPDEATELSQESAWWSFDFSEVTPTTGFTHDRYLVGVAWKTETPDVGYSNYNRDCDANWSDYGDGAGWILNGANSGSECSWPMLRVGLEIVTEETDGCESGTVPLQ